ncbi:MAG TPA: hypothetical protein VMU02_04455 [bacterium]|nr:hypothetical protein [bacterium]
MNYGVPGFRPGGAWDSYKLAAYDALYRRTPKGQDPYTFAESNLAKGTKIPTPGLQMAMKNQPQDLSANSAFWDLQRVLNPRSFNYTTTGYGAAPPSQGLRSGFTQGRF